MSAESVSTAQAVFLRHHRRRERLIHFVRIGLLLLLLVLWEIAAQMGWIDDFLLSSPSRMLSAMCSLAASGELLHHILVTLGETLAGFFLGSVLGIGLAMLLWWWKTLSRVLDPYLVVLNSLPKIALGPVLIVWMGSGAKAIIAMTLLISVIVTLCTVLAGFAEVSPEKITLLRSFGASKWQCLTHVVLPGSLPTIVSALKLGIGMSWVGVIVGEFLVSRAGLGYLIVYGGQVFRLDLVMGATAILCVLAALMYLGVAALEKRLLRRRSDARE